MSKPQRDSIDPSVSHLFIGGWYDGQRISATGHFVSIPYERPIDFRDVGVASYLNRGLAYEDYRLVRIRVNEVLLAFFVVVGMSEEHAIKLLLDRYPCHKPAESP